MSGGQEKNETVAAAWFAGLLALAAGGAGLLIAALAVGIERSWSRRGGGRDLRDAQRRDRYGDALAWLAQDRAARDRYRQARRTWWQSGAHGDPPRGPSFKKRLGTGLLRRILAAFVAIRDFREGFREGWKAAHDARSDGANWWQTAKTRPSYVDPDELKPVPLDRNPSDGESPDPSLDEIDAQCPHCHRWGIRRPGGHFTHTANNSSTCPEPHPKQAVDPSANTTDQGEPAMPVGRPFGGAAPAASHPTPDAPHGDSNATEMAARLAAIEADQKQISDLTDQLASVRATMQAKVVTAAEFAETTGQTAETRQALDASTAVAAQLGEQIGGVSDSATEAAEQLAAAQAGLRVVIEAEDALTSAGADGRAVAPTGAGS